MPSPPHGYKYIGEHSSQNYELAMARDGVYAYKLFGPIATENDRSVKRMWAKAKGRQLTSSDVSSHFTLPKGFNPVSALVGVGYDGHGYNVYVLDLERPLAETAAEGIPSAEDAEFFARYLLDDARKPTQAARIIDARYRRVTKLIAHYSPLDGRRAPAPFSRLDWLDTPRWPR